MGSKSVVRVASVQVYVAGFVVMHLYYYGVLSGVVSSPSFYVNITHGTCYNNRKGGDWEQTLRTVNCNNLSLKGLSGRND